MRSWGHEGGMVSASGPIRLELLLGQEPSEIVAVRLAVALLLLTQTLVVFAGLPTPDEVGFTFVLDL